MFNVAQITRDQVIHRNYMKPFFDETITQMRSQEAGTTGNKYSFFSHKLFLCQRCNKYIQVLSSDLDHKDCDHQRLLCFLKWMIVFQNPVCGTPATRWQ